MRLQSLFVTAVAILVVSAGARAQTDASIGTWKLNLAKSKYNTGAPPKSSTLTITAAGQGTKLEANVVLADGTNRKISYTSANDGKDVAVSGSPDYDTVAIKKVANGTSGERKKGGKVVQTYTRTISADGKTMTVTAKGTNAAGEKVDTVQVYDKQ